MSLNPPSNIDGKPRVSFTPLNFLESKHNALASVSLNPLASVNIATPVNFFRRGRTKAKTMGDLDKVQNIRKELLDADGTKTDRKTWQSSPAGIQNDDTLSVASDSQVRSISKSKTDLKKSGGSKEMKNMMRNLKRNIKRPSDINASGGKSSKPLEDSSANLDSNLAQDFHSFVMSFHDFRLDVLGRLKSIDEKISKVQESQHSIEKNKPKVDEFIPEANPKSSLPLSGSARGVNSMNINIPQSSPRASSHMHINTPAQRSASQMTLDVCHDAVARFDSRRFVGSSGLLDPTDMASSSPMGRASPMPAGAQAPPISRNASPMPPAKGGAAMVRFCIEKFGTMLLILLRKVIEN